MASGLAVRDKMDQNQSGYNRNHSGHNENQQSGYLPYMTFTPAGASSHSTSQSHLQQPAAQSLSRPASVANPGHYGAYQQPAALAQQSYGSNGQTWYGPSTSTTDTTHQVASTLTSLGSNMRYTAKTAGSSQAAAGYRRTSDSYNNTNHVQHATNTTTTQPTALYATTVQPHTQNTYSAQSYSSRQAEPPAPSFEAPRVAAHPEMTASPLMGLSHRHPAEQQHYGKQLAQTQMASARAASPSQIQEAEREKRKAEAEEKKKQRRKENYQNRKSKKKKQVALEQTPTAASPQSESPLGETDPEREIREMMTRIREMNSKHPSLLAKIWEQERQGHIKSQQTAPIPAPQPAPSTPAAPTAASSPKSTTASKAKASKSSIPKQPAPPATKPTPTPALEPPGIIPSSFRASLPVPASLSNVSPGTGPGTKPKGTIWLPEKKEQVSEVAAQFINSSPNNAYNTITPAEFLGILDKNPTYIELCETLEGMGISLDRATFAKTLLNKVPDINSQRQANVGHKVVDLGNHGVGASASQHVPLSTPTPASGFETGSLSQWSSINHHPMPKMQSVNDVLPSIDLELPEATPTPSEPLTKAEAARKSITDLVDLTMDSDDDEPAPILKGPSRYASAFTPGARSERTQTTGLDQNSMETEVHTMPPPPVQIDLPPYLQRLQQKYSLALEEKCRHVELVQPIDKTKVKRRTKYNPATIARDILLATGKHPDFAPLNAHLEPLKISLQKFGRPGFRIDNFADLSTIWWEAIDPGTPTQTIKDFETANVPQKERDNRIPARVHPDHTKPIAVPFVSGGQLQQHAASELASFTTKHNEISGQKKRGPGRPAGSRLMDGKLVVSTAPSTQSSAKPHSIHKPPAKPINTSDALRQNSGSTDGVVENISHPTATPAAKRMKPSFSTPKSAPSRSVSTGAMTPGSGYAAFRAAQALSGEPKKRGRPVGWRKDLHMKLQPASKASSSTRNGGTTDYPESLPLPANHPVFTCKWSGCTAKLHNLDTLRKHVQKMHASLECRWEGCGRFVKMLDNNSGKIESKHQPLRFGDADTWLHHVEQSHIGPVGWSQGDGPRGAFSG